VEVVGRVRGVGEGAVSAGRLRKKLLTGGARQAARERRGQAGVGCVGPLGRALGGR
jgi:hypothetical protein